MMLVYGKYGSFSAIIDGFSMLSVPLRIDSGPVYLKSCSIDTTLQEWMPTARVRYVMRLSVGPEWTYWMVSMDSSN